MADSRLTPEQERLFSAACDGPLEAEDLAALEAALDGNPELQDAYLAFNRLHADLRQHAESSRSVQAALEELSAVSDQSSANEKDEGGRMKDEEQAATVHPSDSHHSPLTPHPFRTFVRSHNFAIAVSVALVAVGAIVAWMAVTYLPGIAIKPDEEKELPEPTDFIARLVNESKVEWLGATQPPKNDPRLWPGDRLAIASGLIEVKYVTGAHVIIEGPAEFTVGGTLLTAVSQNENERVEKHEDSGSEDASNEANRGFLKFGKIVARCETPESHGFTIETANIRVEDLSTEFAVEVSEGGDSDVHVLDGAVRLGIRGPDGSYTFQNLVKGEAAGARSGDTSISSIKFDDARFVTVVETTTDDLLFDDFLDGTKQWEIVSMHTWGADHSIRVPSHDDTHSIAVAVKDGQLVLSGNGPKAARFFDGGAALVSRENFNKQGAQVVAKLDALGGAAQQCAAGVGIVDEAGNVCLCYVRKLGPDDTLLLNAGVQNAGEKAKYVDTPIATSLPNRLALKMTENAIHVTISGERVFQQPTNPDQFAKFRVFVFSTARTASDEVRASFDGVRLTPIEDMERDATE
ncbi:MAG: FecR family protein [Pirellulales bacterium]|nr:FecR family protein [Pirellulales bacterium]